MRAGELIAELTYALKTKCEFSEYRSSFFKGTVAPCALEVLVSSTVLAFRKVLPLGELLTTQPLLLAWLCTFPVSSAVATLRCYC